MCLPAPTSQASKPTSVHQVLLLNTQAGLALHHLLLAHHLLLLLLLLLPGLSGVGDSAA
jgi:hypothetical protein